jgi:hypothetical protein
MSIGLQLLSGLVADGDPAQYRKLALTEKLFFGPEEPLFAYINGHVQKYNALPKPETVAEQFGSLPKPVEPISFYMDQIVWRYAHKTVNKMLAECNELMKAQDVAGAKKHIVEAVAYLQADPHHIGEKPLGSFVMSDHELLAMEFPKREMVVAPFLPTASLAMVFAPTGTGKSWFALELALSVAKGSPFFEWDVPKARRVLYVDGEMPPQDIQERRVTLDPKPTPSLKFLSNISLGLESTSLNLHEPKHQARIDGYLASLPEEQRPALIVFDNLSSLALGKDESSNSDLDGLLSWLIKLRGSGLAVLVVHHSGKDETKGQRGASRRIDLLNTVIRLTKKKSEDPAHSKGACCFDITFDKVRGKVPQPSALTVELDTSELVAKWHTSASDLKAPVYMQALRVIRDEGFKSQKEIAEHLEITASHLSNELKRARDKGLLHADKLELTTEGMKLVEEKFPKAIIDGMG